jgi:hypothetical protein
MFVPHSLMGQRPITLLLTALAAGLTAQCAQARSCAVAETSGIQIEHVVGGDWVPVAAGAAISLRERVRTGADSRLLIRCDDGVEVIVGTDSEVVLGTLAADGNEARAVEISAEKGVVGIDDGEGEFDSLSVRSDLAIASVRGTRWLMEVGDAGTTAVFVRDGAVSVQSAAGVVELVAGEGITVTASATEDKKVWGAPRVAAVSARLGFGWL